MMTVPLNYYLILAFLLFGIGLVGVMVRRNLIIMLMSIELMLNGANLALVAYSRARADMDGQILAFFVMGLAAAEAAVGLALLIGVYRHVRTLDVDKMTTLKG